jgi:DnaJ-class molecular chaperone
MSTGKQIKCFNCDGHGIHLNSNSWDPSPDECSVCDGNGTLWQYDSGPIAKWHGGPFVGRLSAKEMQS